MADAVISDTPVSSPDTVPAGSSSALKIFHYADLAAAPYWGELEEWLGQLDPGRDEVLLSYSLHSSFMVGIIPTMKDGLVALQICFTHP